MRRLSHLRTILLFIKTPPWIPDSSLLSTAMSLDVCRLFLFLQSTDHQSQRKSKISSGSYSLPLPKSLFFFLELTLTPPPVPLSPSGWDGEGVQGVRLGPFFLRGVADFLASACAYLHLTP